MTDNELMDQAGFDEIHRRHSEAVRLFLRRYFGDDVATANDVCEATFQRLPEFAAQYDGRPLKSWLMRIAANQAINHIQSTGAQKRLGDSTVLQAADPIIERLRSGDEMQAALARIADSQREAIQAVYFEGLTWAQTAAKTGVSIGTVKSRLNRGLAFLREILDGQPA